MSLNLVRSLPNVFGVGRFGISAVLACALAISPSLAPPVEAESESPELRSELRRVIAEARDRVFPALVSIRVVTVQYVHGQEWKGQSVGSGTIISAEGHVVTNQHVVQNGQKFVLTLSDKREVDATLVGEDPLTDLALLAIDTSELEGPLPVAAFGDSSALQTGDYVMAMGSPYALSRSVSLGIVSNTERVFAGGFGSDEPMEDELDEGQRTGIFTRWIQHDALIQPGNSGGPLVNLDGEIVGVNQIGLASLGFAIPSNLASEVAEALTAHGEVPRSWVGMSFKPIQRTGLDEGVLINSVDVDGPAAAAGIEAGDVLLEVEGDPVTVRFVEEVPLLLARMAHLPIGEEVAVRVRQGEEEREARLLTRPLEKDVGEETSFHDWGLTTQDITSKMARDRRLVNADGVLVTGARSGGPAQVAEPALEDGDVLRMVDGQRILDLAGLIELYEKLSGDDPRPLLFEFDRQGKNQVALLEPRDEDRSLPPRELPKAWIGIATQPLLTDLASQLGVGETGGFRVTRVYPGTEAAASELRVGDVVVAVGPSLTTPRTMQDAGLLARAVRNLDIGTTVPLRVLRAGEEVKIPVLLEKARPGADEARRFRDLDFEIGVREVTFFDRDENRWEPDQGGVLVEQVEPGGWAALGGIHPDDLVLRVQGREIEGLRDFRQAMESIEEEQPERVEVVVLRGVRTHFQYLEPDWTPSTRASREEGS